MSFQQFVDNYFLEQAVKQQLFNGLNGFGNRLVSVNIYLYTRHR